MKSISVFGYLIFGFFALYYLYPVVSGWTSPRQQVDFRLLRSVEVNYSSWGAEVSFREGSDLVWSSYDYDTCIALKLSRAYFPKNSAKAYEYIRYAQQCPRTELVSLWSGELAWKSGDVSESQRSWSGLADEKLLELGTRYLWEQNYVKSLAVLESINVDNSIDLLPAEEIKYHYALGDIYQRTADSPADWEVAASHYQKAWDLGRKDYLLGYLLGLSYSRLNRCADALPIFLAGLELRPRYTLPLIDSSYYIELGLCHVALGNLDQAQDASARARQYIDAAQGSVNEEHYQAELGKLNILNNSIKSK